MAILKFVPQRVPRRDDINAAMTVWLILLDFIDWVSLNYLGQFKTGTVTLPSGASNGLVVHGLGVANYRAFIIPLQDPLSRYWISNKTSTSFQLNMQTAAPTGGIQFDWLAKGD